MMTTNKELRIFTIGAYGFTEKSFLTALKSTGIDTFIDIRQRRGMRGSEYAWANSNRLQANLNEIGIHYIHIKPLAPTNEIRDKQKEEDSKWGVNKRERTQLGKVFVELYKKNCLTEDNISLLFSEMPEASANAVLFCVEKSPLACHRSLLADYLCVEFSTINGGDIGHGSIDSFKD